MFLNLGRDLGNIEGKVLYDGGIKFRVAKGHVEPLGKEAFFLLKKKQVSRFGLKHTIVSVRLHRVELDELGLFNINRGKRYALILAIRAHVTSDSMIPEATRYLIVSGDIGEGFDLKGYLFGTYGRHYNILKNDLSFELRKYNNDLLRVKTPSFTNPSKSRYPSGEYLLDALETWRPAI